MSMDDLATAEGAIYQNLNISRSGPAIKCVVLDPGHGGKDGGCYGHHVHEKDISLIIAKKLKTKLERRFPNLKVVMTRDRDVFVPLHKRAKIANDLHADLFISIHCNSAPNNPSAVGTETFVLGLHRAEDNLKVAKRENESILLEENYQRFYGGFDPNASSTHILMSMFQNAYLDQSIIFADQIERQSEANFQRRTRGVKQAGFAVLRLTTMPSVLFESGFLSNQQEAKYLNSDKGQEHMAEQLFNAFVAYKNDLDLKQQQLYKVENSSSGILKTHQNSVTTPAHSADHHIYYSVQVASTRQALDNKPNNWRTITDIYALRSANGYKYLIGKYKDKQAAKRKLKELKAKGIQDAFITKHPSTARLVFP